MGPRKPGNDAIFVPGAVYLSSSAVKPSDVGTIDGRAAAWDDGGDEPANDSSSSSLSSLCTALSVRWETWGGGHRDNNIISWIPIPSNIIKMRYQTHTVYILIFASKNFRKLLEMHSGKICADFYFRSSGRSNLQFFYLAHILCSCTHQYECDDVLDGF